jgi:DNA processing protein
MRRSALHYWLALLRAPGIGSIRGYELLQKVPQIPDLFSATSSMLANFGLTKKTMDGLLDPKWELIEQDLAWLQKPNHHFITIQDDLYPPLLKEIPDPPLALYICGDPQILANPQLAMVGSRSPSHTGLDNAYDFAKFLAQARLSITSGFAIGIDAESHKGALNGDGKTIAVMGTGLDKLYPAQNKALAKHILQQGGALVSEYPINTPVKAENFPRRNRIISGLCIGTLVVEATIRSGSLITARLATEQGREVFAIPGSIHNPLARGCHTLIRQGAKLIETAQDILEELGPLAFTTMNKTNNEYNKEKTVTNEQKKLDSEYQKLLQYIEYEATPVDILVERSGFSASNVSSMLLILELEGHIKSTPGGYIKLNQKKL